MKTYRTMTAAALVAAVGTVGALSIGSALGQQGTPPRPTTPGQTQPGQSPTTPQPGQRPGMTQPGGQNTVADERLFALEGAAAERQIQQLGQKLSQMEQQMMRNHQQLSQQLTQAQQLQGDQKVNAIAGVLEDIVNEHEQLHTYLVEIRTSLTGEVDSPGTTTPARPTTPSTPRQPGQPSEPGQPPR